MYILSDLIILNIEFSSFLTDRVNHIRIHQCLELISVSLIESFNMKKLYILLGVCFSASSKCTKLWFIPPSKTYLVGYLNGEGSTTFDLGLSEDSIDVTNDDQIRFVQGQDTSFEIQYLMPQQFDVSSMGIPGVSVVDVSGVTILGVSGLPSGLSWNLDQAGAQNGNSYSPANNRFGAFKICGTTFSAPGIYQVEVLKEWQRVGYQPM